MRVSQMPIPGRALATLSGAACLMLSAAPLPAQTVVETAHYQSQIVMSCDSVVCAGALDSPGRKRRLHVTRIACEFKGTPKIPFRYGAVELRQPDGAHVLYQYLPPGHSSATGVHSINQAVDVQVGARQNLVVELVLAGGSAIGGSCNAAGTLSRLQ